MFNPVSKLLGWGRKIRKLRKDWDRTREKTLKKDPGTRSSLLPKEDQIEQNLRILEERKLSRGERSRLYNEIKTELETVKTMLETEGGDYQAPEASREKAVRQQEQQQRIEKKRQKEQEEAY